MATYIELWDLQNNEAFQKRIRYALTVAASNIMGEADESPRKAWARKVFAGSLQTPIQLIALRVLGNPVVAEAGNTGPDTDLQFVVNQMASDLIALG